MKLVMQKQTTKKYSKGLSLIEILVTVVVLSIGLLGIAGMQAQGVKYSNDSYARSQATMMANELIERMHANPDGVANADYVTAIGNAALDCSAITNEPAPNCTGANSCDVTQLAALDVFRIRCGQPLAGAFVGGVEHQLPLGGIDITCVDADTSDANLCTDDNARTVTVTWQNPDEKGDVTETLQVQVNARFL